MNVLYLLIPIALVIVVIAIKLLFWAINNGQYDDLDMEGHRILFDDDDAQLSKNQSSNNKPPEAKVSKDKESQDMASKNNLSEHTKNKTFINKKPKSINENKSENDEK